MKCTQPISIKNPKWVDGDLSQPRGLLVPCGKCLGCLQDRRNEWAFRLSLEASQSDVSFFVTLTYEELFLPRSRSGYGTLRKKDCQNFIHRLRKRLERSFEIHGLRYFLSGEYGPSTKRPHYHALFFLPYFPLSTFADVVNSEWRFGFVDVKPLTDGGGSYAAKYICKLCDVPEGCEKPFSIMSRKPAIGSRFSANYSEYVRRSGSFCVKSKDGTTHKLPRTFRSKIFTDSEISDISQQNLEYLIREQSKKDTYQRVSEVEQQRCYNDIIVKNRLTKNQKL